MRKSRLVLCGMACQAIATALAMWQGGLIVTPQQQLLAAAMYATIAAGLACGNVVAPQLRSWLRRRR